MKVGTSFEKIFPKLSKYGLILIADMLPYVQAKTNFLVKDRERVTSDILRLQISRQGWKQTAEGIKELVDKGVVEIHKDGRMSHYKINTTFIEK